MGQIHILLFLAKNRKLVVVHKKMKIETPILNNTEIADVVLEQIIIKKNEDGIAIFVNLYYQGFDKIVLHEINITPDFFDLKNGMVSEILQKFYD